MSLERLRGFTTARVALGRAGDSLPTRELLEFQLAHARAIDAVYSEMDSAQVAFELRNLGFDCATVHSAARDRVMYLRRPDLGRRLDEESRARLIERRGEFDAVFVIADGLSALAAQSHAARVLELMAPSLGNVGWKFAPVVIVEQGRVAVGDDVAACIGASQCAVLIGERPGLSSPDSLGAYITWNPGAKTTDADRNCVSNIRADGLSYAAAASRITFLMTEARRRKISGVGLKEEDNARFVGPARDDGAVRECGGDPGRCSGR
jgi:ethanolamine ammonia-lyase small subunit